MDTTEGDWSNMFDDKAVEGGHKTICFEVATLDISGTIFEELLEIVK